MKHPVIPPPIEDLILAESLSLLGIEPLDLTASHPPSSLRYDGALPGELDKLNKFLYWLRGDRSQTGTERAKVMFYDRPERG